MTSTNGQFLPHELLRQIFIHARCFYHDELRGHEWLNVTSVCQYWRAVGICCPVLWTDIVSPGHIEWTRVLLERSQDLGLNITIMRLPPHRFELRDGWDDLELALSHKGRFKSLTVNLNARIPDFLSAHLLEAETGTMLERLDLTFYHAGSEKYFRFPPTFLGGRAPNLRCLTLNGVDVPASWPPLANITHLFVTTDIEWHVPFNAHVLESLPTMTLLQYLHLRGVAPQVLPRNSVMVHLEHLKGLILEDTTEGCSNVLKVITFPSTTCISICCNDEPLQPTGLAIKELSSRLRQHVDRIPEPIIGELHVTASLWKVDFEFRNKMHDSEVILTLSMERDGDSLLITEVAQVVTLLLSIASHKGVRNAIFDLRGQTDSFEEPIPFSPNRWAIISNFLPDLEYIEHRGTYAETLLSALASVSLEINTEENLDDDLVDYSSLLSTPYNYPIFPKLRHLRLSGLSPGQVNSEWINELNATFIRVQYSYQYDNTILGDSKTLLQALLHHLLSMQRKENPIRFDLED